MREFQGHNLQLFLIEEEVLFHMIYNTYHLLS